MPTHLAAPAIVASLALLSSCAPAARPTPPAPSAATAPTGASAPAAASVNYADPQRWLCLPGRDDACARDLSATDVHADGKREIEHPPPPADTKVDCFYVYPTVDIDLTPGNHERFDDLEPMAGAAVAQAARFRQVCAIYAPLYRQVTIGTYLHPDTLEEHLAIAFSDVESAFGQFLAARDRGRPLVLLGHSQGAEMIVRLLKRFFDADAALRARLLVAMPIGGEVEVPAGKVAGATFANLPLCTKPDETACVVAYRSHEAGSVVAPGREAPRPGNVTACVNPAGLGDAALHPLARAYLPLGRRGRRWMRGASDIETPFVELEGFYAAQCVEGPGGYRYLAVSLVNTPGDTRTNPVDYGSLPLHKVLGLHVLDLQLPQGDLLNLVARRAAAVTPR
jgi:hypothetical protein